jgi:hypothetical protein
MGNSRLGFTQRDVDPLGRGDAAQLDEIDRNARAYGWEIGRGQSISEQVETTEGNPFLDPNWRAQASDLRKCDENTLRSVAR